MKQRDLDRPTPRSDLLGHHLIGIPELPPGVKLSFYDGGGHVPSHLLWHWYGVPLTIVEAFDA